MIESGSPAGFVALMSRPPRLCLVDGSSYLYRAFHAVPNLTAGDGRPTGAIYGVANMVRRLLDQYQPDYIAVIFDAPGKTFRHDSYAEYKATRPPMPDELKAQVEPLNQLIEAMGLTRLAVAGVEADDVIATLTRMAREANLDVLISSGDKDLAQLVADGVVLEDTMQNKQYDRLAVEAKFGVGPERVADLLALTGDRSDNIPGVAKVGPKTAARWLREYGDLDGVIEHADEIADKGVDRIVCMAVNDVFVMDAWGKSAGVGDKITMAADGNADFAQALGLGMDGRACGMGQRAQRFAMIVRDGEIVEVLVESPGEFQVSSAEHVLSTLPQS